MGTWWRDIRYGIRMLAKSPGFTLVAALTLGLGIGATATLFGVFKTWILDPFPYPDADRIVHVWSNVAKDGDGPLSAPDFLDMKDAFDYLLGLEVPLNEHIENEERIFYVNPETSYYKTVFLYKFRKE